MIFKCFFGGFVLKKLITSVGVGRYHKCIYISEDGFKARPSRFVQTALYEYLKHQGEEIDEVYILITDLAKKKNFEDVKEKSGEIRKGLKSIWEEYFPEDEVELHIVPIPEEQSEKNQWVIFEEIFNIIQPKDEIYFDITHSFRSIPLMALLVTNFARVVHEATIKRLFYGNFEVLFGLGEISKIPIEARQAPIVDITSIANLLDWTMSVESFLTTGNPMQIDQLADRKMPEFHQDERAIAIKRLTNSLNHFNQHLETSRGEQVYQEISNVLNNFKQVQENSADIFPQFSKLMSKIEEKIKVFSNDRDENRWEIIKWCVDHGLYQQAYTFAREYIISIIYETLEQQEILPEVKTERDIRDIRDAISSIIFELLKHGKILSLDKKYEELIDPIKQLVEEKKDAFNIFPSILIYRNNINHAEKAQNEKLTPVRINHNAIRMVKEIKPIFYK